MAGFFDLQLPVPVRTIWAIRSGPYFPICPNRRDIGVVRGVAFEAVHLERYTS